MINKPLVLKVGGSFFDDNNAQQDFFAALSMLLAKGRRIVVVHGGGNQVQNQLQALGFASSKHKGLRVTPDEHMPTVTGVLAGTLNKSLVIAAQQQSIAAVGLSLADGDMCICSQIDPLLGAVGMPHPQNATLLNLLIDAHYLPVISSIGRDNNGNLFNVNADQAATCVAQLLDAELYLLSDVPGVLNEHKVLVDSLSTELAKAMIDAGVITDGMIVKVEAAQAAANELKRPVVVGSWAAMSHIVTTKLNHVGTLITPKFAPNNTPDDGSAANSIDNKTHV